jgi:hypothetical protein
VRGVVLTPSGEARHRTFQDWNKVGRLTRTGRKSWNAIGRPGRVDDRAPCSAARPYKYAAFRRCILLSSDLAFVSDGRDLSSVLSDRQGDCLVLVVLCSVPVS